MRYKLRIISITVGLHICWRSSLHNFNEVEFCVSLVCLWQSTTLRKDITPPSRRYTAIVTPIPHWQLRPITSKWSIAAAPPAVHHIHHTVWPTSKRVVLRREPSMSTDRRLVLPVISSSSDAIRLIKRLLPCIMSWTRCAVDVEGATYVSTLTTVCRPVLVSCNLSCSCGQQRIKGRRGQSPNANLIESSLLKDQPIIIINLPYFSLSFSFSSKYGC